jgi:hypothetical protein
MMIPIFIKAVGCEMCHVANKQNVCVWKVWRGFRLEIITAHISSASNICDVVHDEQFVVHARI